MVERSRAIPTETGTVIDHFMTMQDGRKLAVNTFGDPNGDPVFLIHGSPGSRIGPVPRNIRLYHKGIWLITSDKPGYGYSDRKEGRTVADAAADVKAIADSLGLDTFSVVGRSRGGPDALACAALLPDRVTKAAVHVGLVPHDEMKTTDDWLSGMTPSNRAGYASSDQSTIAEITRLTHIATHATDLSSFPPDLTQRDRIVIRQTRIEGLLLAAYREGLRQGPGGWIDDALAVKRPWGFNLSDINLPVLIYHGRDDHYNPTEHSRVLASRIPTATLRIDPDGSHFTAFEIFMHTLGWLQR